MSKLQAKYALPKQEQNGDYIELGTYAEIIKDIPEVRLTAKGVWCTDAEGNQFFLNYSDKVVAEIKASKITENNMGHLIVAESHYTGEDGQPTMRYKLSVPRGYSGAAVNGAEMAAKSTTQKLAPKTVSLESIKLVDLVA